jgi:hypothetical protein
MPGGSDPAEDRDELFLGGLPQSIGQSDDGDTKHVASILNGASFCFVPIVCSLQESLRESIVISHVRELWISPQEPTSARFRQSQIDREPTCLSMCLAFVLVGSVNLIAKSRTIVKTWTEHWKWMLYIDSKAVAAQLPRSIPQSCRG